MRIIAQDTAQLRFIVETKPKTGVVVDLNTSRVYGENSIISILARGYWALPTIDNKTKERVLNLAEG